MRPTNLIYKILVLPFFWLTPLCRHARPTPIPLSRGATGGRPRRSGKRRTLRASVLHPTLPGRLRAPTRRTLRPASEQLRFGRSYVDDGPGSASWDSWGDPDSVKCRGRAPAGARPASLGARRPGVIACHPARHGCGQFPHQRLPALCPLFAEGTKKEAHPARF